MMDKVFPGDVVFHIVPALWQGYGVGVAASILQTLYILLGNESESRHGLAQCLCCPVPAKAWNCSSLHIFHFVIHTQLHISFITAASALLLQPQVPKSCFSQAPLLQSSLFISLSL